MLTNWVRVIRKDDTTYTDYSLLNDNEATTVPTDIVAADDAIYIGKVYPFNNFYIWMNTVNALSSNMIIKYWDGSAWENAVDILDATSVGGKTLGQSGLVQFSPKQSKTWAKTTDTSLVHPSVPTDLNSFTIYNLYWLKITFSNDLTLTSKIKRIFYLFSNQQTLEALDIDTNSYLTNAFSGQTDFTKQIFAASKETLLVLKAKGIVLNEGHILRLEDVYLSVAWRTLATIYFSLGKDYVDRRKEALAMAGTTLNTNVLTLDQNQNAFVEDTEVDSESGGISRI